MQFDYHMMYLFRAIDSRVKSLCDVKPLKKVINDRDKLAIMCHTYRMHLLMNKATNEIRELILRHLANGRPLIYLCI